LMDPIRSSMLTGRVYLYAISVLAILSIPSENIFFSRSAQVLPWFALTVMWWETYLLV
jgi:hypothetical protein